ncbi:family 16 glycosylhydrolase [Geodermatophilus normandii]|uniref:family 16 glycosylhydrolase n=1 Tax=Geodermatophilus normandii TaxID=1137989 RepID=UPI003CCC4F7B
MELPCGDGGLLRGPRLLPAAVPPRRDAAVVPRRPPAPAGLGHPVRRLLRAGRQHGRPAAGAPRGARPRGAARALGLDAALRAAGDARPRDRDAAVDGRLVAGRARGLPGALRRAVRRGGVRRRRRPRRGRGIGHGRAPLPRPAAGRRLRRARPGIDVAEWHTYAVDWRPDGAAFSVDGEVVREVAVVPDYPVQSMVAVFDFPEKAVPGEPYVVPELVVDSFRGRNRVTAGRGRG